MHGCQGGFAVVEFDMGRAAVLKEINHLFRPGGEMSQALKSS
ncbi:MAG: hypothetical protein M2R45_00345 [Verrucomicrobia subdivision 3 bacterium]|nr:hypothetical protein [Limisphaerales bacterium]MCS1412897.1 hypothetical protein [Limisphaerales bacterium]